MIVVTRPLRAAFGVALLALLLVPVAPAADISARVTIDVAARGTAVDPTMHGLFFEDINFAADGGLYAELVRNRSFEGREPLFPWTEVRRQARGKVSVETSGPLNGNNPRYVRLTVEAGEGATARDAAVGLSNAGFGGIALRAGEKYFFSLHARSPRQPASLSVQLELPDGRVVGRAKIEEIGAAWRKHEAEFISAMTTPEARLVVLASPGVAVDLDMVSLFPASTFKNRRNGMRADLAQMLADMKPGFLRFPGGCIVEGVNPHNMYRWKDTVGDVAERKENFNLWGTNEGPSAHYNQSYGLGFFEYFVLAEDLGAVPVPIVNCGMCCQARNGPPIPLGELQPFIQDALDLIEFANGPVTSTWGAKRAAMGHPEPFNLKYLGVGNEQWEEVYFERYALFWKALKEKHPEIVLITTSGPFPDDHLWRLAWNKFKSGTPAEIVDEHYYKPPQWFLTNTERYDSYDRNGPKVFVGEFAAHDNRRNNLRSAIAEATAMAGFWRNADVVTMSAYAPLFAKIGHTQWEPNLIWFDNQRVYATPSYHAQAMFGRHRPDVVLPTQVEISGAAAPQPVVRFGVGTWYTEAEFKDVKVEPRAAGATSVALQNWELLGDSWQQRAGVLHQPNADRYDVRAVTEIPYLTDYVLTLKARRLSGREGFMVFFDTGADDFARWNVGGWNNQNHALDVPGAERVFGPGSVENGQWYDVRVEVLPGAVKAYLDGKLVQETTRPAPRERKPIATLVAVAGRDAKANELVVQVVNPSPHPVKTTLALQGAALPETNATLLVLTGDPGAENSMEHPNRVMPRGEWVRVSGRELTRDFPAHSLTTLRVPLPR